MADLKQSGTMPVVRGIYDLSNDRDENIYVLFCEMCWDRIEITVFLGRFQHQLKHARFCHRLKVTEFEAINSSRTGGSAV